MFSEFRAKFQKLKYLSFEGHDRHDWLTLELSDEQLLTELSKSRDADLFLGHFPVSRIREELEKHGVLEKLKSLGYPEVVVEIRTDEVFTHRLYVHTGQRDYDHILIELRLREGIFQPRRQFIPDCPIGPLPMIMVDWLLLQNPRKSFGEDRTPLPQQRFPGLGLLPILIPMVREAAQATGRAGVLDVPEHYHGALFYSRWFHFLNPEMEGRFLAMQRDLADYPLAVISHTIDRGGLINKTRREPELWSPGEQILPLSQTLVEYFNHPRYQQLRDQAFLETSYDLDRQKMNSQRGGD